MKLMKLVEFSHRNMTVFKFLEDISPSFGTADTSVFDYEFPETHNLNSNKLLNYHD